MSWPALTKCPHLNSSYSQEKFLIFGVSLPADLLYLILNLQIIRIQPDTADTVGTFKLIKNYSDTSSQSLLLENCLVEDVR